MTTVVQPSGTVTFVFTDVVGNNELALTLTAEALPGLAEHGDPDGLEATDRALGQLQQRDQ